MYEQDALDQLRDKYRFAPLLVNIDTVSSDMSAGHVFMGVPGVHKWLT